VLTSAADLAAFTGHFRMPIGVSGHATGSATSDNGDLSAGFKTQTSASITVIYHYLPNLPSLDQPPSSPGSSNPGGTSAVPGGSSRVHAGSARPHASSAHTKKNGSMGARTSFHKAGRHSAVAASSR